RNRAAAAGLRLAGRQVFRQGQSAAALRAAIAVRWCRGAEPRLVALPRLFLQEKRFVSGLRTGAEQGSRLFSIALYPWRLPLDALFSMPRRPETEAGEAKLVDAPDLGSGIARCGGSSPFARTSARGPSHRRRQRYSA